MRGAVILASATPKSRLSDQDALDLRIPLPVDLLEEVDILQCPWQRMDVSMVLPIMHNLPSTVNPKIQARDPDTLRDEEAYWQVKYPHRQND